MKIKWDEVPYLITMAVFILWGVARVIALLTGHTINDPFFGEITLDK